MESKTGNVASRIVAFISDPDNYISTMSKESAWGPILSGPIKGAQDKVHELIERVEKIKKSLPLKPNETLDEHRIRRDALINKIEHQISDLIYFKKQKALGR